jgi:hypothetical protein
VTSCPNCGSRHLRPAWARSLNERLNQLRFITPLRCKDCKHRFVAPTLTWNDIRYSRCPICLRQDLNGWTGKTYEPPFWTAVKVKFGAHKWRCEYCRLNFASFRLRKEIFTFSRWKKMALPGLPGPAETVEESSEKAEPPVEAIQAVGAIQETGPEKRAS